MGQVVRHDPADSPLNWGQLSWAATPVSVNTSRTVPGPDLGLCVVQFPRFLHTARFGGILARIAGRAFAARFAGCARRP